MTEMKKNTSKILLIALLSVCSLTFYGCTDWLNVQPRDRMLEPERFSTEDGINSVLNGIYRDLSHRHSYGQYLTQTFVEYLARYYYWRVGNHVFPDFLEWGRVAEFNYENRGVHGKIQSIWNHAFGTIQRINIFIENVEAREGVMSERRRNVVLGEAYALRAFIHFDMFRLFGPIRMTDAHGGLPYNNTTRVIAHPNLSAADFINLVMQDLETALRLLEDDPIRTRGVNDNFVNISGNILLTPEDIFAEYYRNRRMNYFAVRALQARVLLHTGEHQRASSAAQATLEAIAERRTFQWEDNLSNIINHNNFIFHREVLFGLNNPTLHDSWIDLFNGVRPGSTHAVVTGTLYGNLFADFAGMPLAAMNDIRARQWTPSSIDSGFAGMGVPMPESYVSIKFRRLAVTNWQNRPFTLDFQPLMRMSELYFIIAEAALARGDTDTAIDRINSIMRTRGFLAEQLIPSTASIAEIRIRLEREIYKEFVGEGQAFFYLKRNNINRIFRGNAVGHETIPDTGAVFVLPLPDSETMI